MELYCEGYHVTGKCPRRNCRKKHNHYLHKDLSTFPVELARAHLSHEQVVRDCFFCYFYSARLRSTEPTGVVTTRCPSLISNKTVCTGPMFCKKSHESIWSPEDTRKLHRDKKKDIINFSKATGVLIPQFDLIYPLDLLWHLNIIPKDDVDRISYLPDELLLKIFKNVVGNRSMRHNTLVNLKRVCKRFRRIANDWTLWKRVPFNSSHCKYYQRLKLVNDCFGLNYHVFQHKSVISAYGSLFKFRKRYSDLIDLYDNVKEDLIQNSPFQEGDIVIRKEDVFASLDVGFEAIQGYQIYQLCVVNGVDKGELRLCLVLVPPPPSSKDKTVAVRCLATDVVTETQAVSFFYQMKEVQDQCGWYDTKTVTRQIPVE